jgi:hypothetical protein
MEFQDDAPDGEIVDTPVKPGAIRIILADSQAIYRVGIRKVFALEDDLRVVAQADSLENLRLAIERYPTDIVLLEGGLLTGTANVIPELLRAAPDVNCIAAAFAESSPVPSRPICWSGAFAESPPAKPGSTINL